MDLFRTKGDVGLIVETNAEGDILFQHRRSNRTIIRKENGPALRDFFNAQFPKFISSQDRLSELLNNPQIGDSWTYGGYNRRVSNIIGNNITIHSDSYSCCDLDKSIFKKVYNSAYNINLVQR